LSLNYPSNCNLKKLLRSIL
ncbi:hypothetical protein CP8484711_0123, partial [Chlamydia psittaci 84-8471/1]